MSIAEPVILPEKTPTQESVARFSSIGSIQYSWTLIAGVLIFWTILYVVYLSVLRETGGKFIYAMDDAYISAAMGRNLAQHGILGVTRYGFSSSSSSIIWPFLLALSDLVLRMPEHTPFILNIMLGTALIVFFYLLLRRAEPRAPSAYIFTFIAALILFVPLPLLVFISLEHILHIIATLGFAYCAALELSSDEPPGKSAPALVTFAVLVTLARYEGMFIVTLVATLFVLRRRWRRSGTVLAAGLAPVLAYGVWAKAAGWFFLPGSVLAKSDGLEDVIAGILSFRASNKIFVPTEVQVLFLVAAILFLARFMRTGRLWSRIDLLLLIFLSTTLVHLRVAKTGSVFRYEAYLIALGLLAIGCALYEHLQQIRSAFDIRSFVICSLILLVLWNEGIFLMQRARAGLVLPPLAAKNIYEQQFQMARFVRKYYPGDVVVANDIGAINFFADIHCIDLGGLGTREVTKMVLDHQFSPERVASFAKDKHAQIAILYDKWFLRGGGLPPEWTRIGNWTISDNVVDGGDTVTFFATQPAEVAPLMKNLRDFANQLPPTVHQEGAYLR